METVRYFVDGGNEDELESAAADSGLPVVVDWSAVADEDDEESDDDVVDSSSVSAESELATSDEPETGTGIGTG